MWGRRPPLRCDASLVALVAGLTVSADSISRSVYEMQELSIELYLVAAQIQSIVDKERDRSE